MKDFVEYVVKSIVDHPEQVEIETVSDERGTLFEVKLNQGDVGRVIGRQGQTINAIRSLVQIKAQPGQRVTVEIVEERPQRDQDRDRDRNRRRQRSR